MDQPDYLYPAQWADELGSLYTMTQHVAPAMSVDLTHMPVGRGTLASVSQSIFQSQISPY